MFPAILIEEVLKFVEAFTCLKLIKDLPCLSNLIQRKSILSRVVYRPISKKDFILLDEFLAEVKKIDLSLSNDKANLEILKKFGDLEMIKWNNEAAEDSLNLHRIIQSSPNLVELHISRSICIDTQLTSLIRNNLRCLTELDLSGTPITDDFLKELNYILKNVKKLSLQSCINLTATGILENLKQSFYLNYLNLSYLDLFDYPVLLELVGHLCSLKMLVLLNCHSLCRNDINQLKKSNENLVISHNSILDSNDEQGIKSYLSLLVASSA